MNLQHADLVEAAVRRIVRDGEYPSPARVQRMIGARVTHNLSGRDCAVRNRVLLELGWSYVPRPVRSGPLRTWQPPTPTCPHYAVELVAVGATLDDPGRLTWRCQACDAALS